MKLGGILRLTHVSVVYRVDRFAYQIRYQFLLEPQGVDYDMVHEVSYADMQRRVQPLSFSNSDSILEAFPLPTWLTVGLGGKPVQVLVLDR